MKYGGIIEFYLQMIFFFFHLYPTAGGLGMQQKTGGLFGQSPMLGGSSSGSNAIGSGLLGQNSVGGAGGLFNKTQTSGTGILGGGIAQSSGFFNPGWLT